MFVSGELLEQHSLQPFLCRREFLVLDPRGHLSEEPMSSLPVLGFPGSLVKSHKPVRTYK